METYFPRQELKNRPETRQKEPRHDMIGIEHYLTVAATLFCHWHFSGYS